jgi:hypothetical protein
MWRGTLALLYIPALLIVITVWIWLNQWLRLPAWVGWVFVGATIVAFVTISLVGLPRLKSLARRNRRNPNDR